MIRQPPGRTVLKVFQQQRLPGLLMDRQRSDIILLEKRVDLYFDFAGWRIKPLEDAAAMFAHQPANDMGLGLPEGG
jgi:hypothetical protein